MTDTPKPASKTPTHVAYHVKDGNSGKGYWTRIGAAWAHADGKPRNRPVHRSGSH